MREHVKRDYHSGLRAAQAEQTRRSIVSAAARLFVDEGYGATTIDAVAQSAGVSRKTVFTAVGGKVDLLKTALDWAVAGDDQPVAVADRPEVRELLAMDDPAALLTSWVRIMVAIEVRVAGLFRVLEIAAGGSGS
jgi:AcrR family transcriptional regulator